MRKPLITLLLMLLCCASVFAQDVCTDEANYDRFKDETEIVCPVIEINEVSITIIAVHPGKVRVAPAKISFHFFHRYDPRLRAEYGDADTFYILTDAARRQVAVTDYQTARGSVTSVEAAFANLAADDLAAINSAKTFEARYGKTEFKLDASALAKLKDFIKRQTEGKEKQ